MQYMIRGEFDEEYTGMPPEQQRTSIESKWAKSREYYAKGLLRFIWLFKNQLVIMSIFEVDSRERIELTPSE